MRRRRGGRFDARARESKQATARLSRCYVYVFLLSKSPKYYFDVEAIKEEAICGSRGSQYHTGKTGQHQQGRAQVRPSAVKGSFEGKHGGKAFLAIREMRRKRTVWTYKLGPLQGTPLCGFPTCTRRALHSRGLPRGRRRPRPLYRLGNYCNGGRAPRA